MGRLAIWPPARRGARVFHTLGATTAAIAANCSAAATTVIAWNTSWKPNTRGHGLGHFVASEMGSAGSLDGYDLVWGFDDINRITSRTDKLAASTTTFGYTGSKHAVVSLSGGSSGSYGYDAVGAMTSRDGTTLTYDSQQRLTGYGSVESYVYGVSNQRLIRTAGTTRTLYLPGMEVTDTAGAVTVTRYLTIGGTVIGTKTGAGTSGVAWNCGSLAKRREGRQYWTAQIAR